MERRRLNRRRSVVQAKGRYIQTDDVEASGEISLTRVEFVPESEIDDCPTAEGKAY